MATRCGMFPRDGLDLHGTRDTLASETRGYSVPEISGMSSFQAGAGSAVAREDTGMISALVSVSEEDSDGTAAAMR